jgi:hypothetical protein
VPFVPCMPMTKTPPAAKKAGSTETAVNAKVLVNRSKMKRALIADGAIVC